MSSEYNQHLRPTEQRIAKFEREIAGGHCGRAKNYSLVDSFLNGAVANGHLHFDHLRIRRKVFGFARTGESGQSPR